MHFLYKDGYKFLMKAIIIRSNPILPDPRVEKECYALKNNGIDVEVLAWDRSANYYKKNESLVIKGIDIPVQRFGIKGIFGGGIKANFIPLLKFQFRFLKWLIYHRKEYNVIHACDFDTALMSFFCARLIGKKFVYDIFDYYVEAFSIPKRLKGIIKALDDFIISKADSVIICTEKRRKQINYINSAKTTIIHNSPDLFMGEKVIKNFPKDNGKIRFVYVGILQDGRFIKELIDVIKYRNDCELHIGGFGVLEEEIVEETYKYSNIKFYGKLSYNRTLELENWCDIITAIYDPRVPNHYYAAPNKFYEALMLGKPLIMVKNTGMDQIVAKYNIGQVINFDKDELMQAIDKLILEKDNWKETAIRMKKIYYDNYSWIIMEKRLISLYTKL